jgi:hypothetical protein
MVTSIGTKLAVGATTHAALGALAESSRWEEAVGGFLEGAGEVLSWFFLGGDVSWWRSYLHLETSEALELAVCDTGPGSAIIPDVRFCRSGVG